MMQALNATCIASDGIELNYFRYDETEIKYRLPNTIFMKFTKRMRLNFKNLGLGVLMTEKCMP